MKVSYHNATKGEGSAIHNCRSYDYEKKSPHINPLKVKENVYVCIYPKLSNDFVAAEEKFYKKNLKKVLQLQNENAIKYGHKERVMSMKQYRNGKTTRPEETILQIGNISESVSRAELKQLFNELQSYNREISKGHCVILNAAIHMDEATPHIHIRKLWLYQEKDKNGETYLKIGKEKAMKEAGIELPERDSPEGKYNNRNMTYTKLMREKAEIICKEMGLDIDDINREQRTHLEKNDYIALKIREEKLRTRKRQLSQASEIR